MDTKNLLPFNNLGDINTTIKEWEYKATLRNGREIAVSRCDWEDAPCPLRTLILNDETMQKIADITARELNAYADFDDEDNFQDCFWKEYEYATQLFAPYYEDLNESIPIGTKVFNLCTLTYSKVKNIKDELAVLEDGHVEEMRFLIAEY